MGQVWQGLLQSAALTKPRLITFIRAALLMNLALKAAVIEQRGETHPLTHPWVIFVCTCTRCLFFSPSLLKSANATYERNQMGRDVWEMPFLFYLFGCGANHKIMATSKAAWGRDGDARRCWCFRKSPLVIKEIPSLWFKQTNLEENKVSNPQTDWAKKGIARFYRAEKFCHRHGRCHHEVPNKINSKRKQIGCDCYSGRTIQTCTQEKALNGLASLTSFNIFSLIKLFNSPA